MFGYQREQVGRISYNLLPKLCDGGGKVGGVGGNPKGFVLAVGVLNALIGVPGLIALGPRQLWPETLRGQRNKAEGLSEHEFTH